jgi:hypothetical protein
MEELIKRIYLQAQQLGACSKFTGQEKTLEEIISLFLSPQGLEFCIKNHFPSMAALRMFKPFAPERYGIYIDAGTITLRNPAQAVFIGKTCATVFCDTLERHSLTAMHGAKAVINASKWAVVHTAVESGSIMLRNTTENAIIL